MLAFASLATYQYTFKNQYLRTQAYCLAVAVVRTWAGHIDLDSCISAVALDASPDASS